MNKSIVLMTHFTFASYKDYIPQFPKTVGFKPLLEGQFSDYDTGTFDKNLMRVYRLICNNQKIQVILTGHSHRRGLYTLNTVRGNIQNYELHHWLQFDFYDFCDLPEIIDKHKKHHPLFIVSDSAGPIPRRNEFGEFNGWGSDAASGTQVDFDSDGQVDVIRSIPVSKKPRIAVALDYWDIIEKENIITEFKSNIFKIRDEKKCSDSFTYKFSIQLHEHIIELGINLSSIILYCKDADASCTDISPWQKVSLIYNASEQRWLPSDSRLITHFARHKERGLFLSIKFTAGDKNEKQKMIGKLYDFDSYWNFECQIESRQLNLYTSKQYIVKRDKSRASEPDFNWREQIEKYL